MISSIGNECLALDGSTGSCHVLNETAGWLLSVSKDFVSLEHAVELARMRYTVPDDVDLAAEIEGVVLEMERRGIVETNSTPST
jgi:hypothetical protein